MVNSVQPTIWAASWTTGQLWAAVNRNAPNTPIRWLVEAITAIRAVCSRAAIASPKAPMVIRQNQPAGPRKK